HVRRREERLDRSVVGEPDRKRASVRSAGRIGDLAALRRPLMWRLEDLEAAYEQMVDDPVAGGRVEAELGGEAREDVGAERRTQVEVAAEQKRRPTLHSEGGQYTLES